MNSTYNISKSIADRIAAMREGSHTSISKMVDKVDAKVNDDGMFSVLGMVEYLCAKQGVLLDFSAWAGMCVGLPYNLDFEVVHIGTIGAKHARLHPRYACVLHHPLRGCEAWPEMNPTDFPVDFAVLEFQGLIEDAVGQRYANDAGGSFAFDAVGIGEGSYSVAFLDESGIPYIALTVDDGEPCEENVPLCDAMESWTVAVSESPLDVSAVMDGYRLEGDRYISIEDEEERDEFFRSWEIQ